MWLLAHAVDGCDDMDGCFVLALFFFLSCIWWTIECVKPITLSLRVASRCTYGGPLNASADGRLNTFELPAVVASPIVYAFCFATLPKCPAMAFPGE